MIGCDNGCRSSESQAEQSSSARGLAADEPSMGDLEAKAGGDSNNQAAQQAPSAAGPKVSGEGYTLEASVVKPPLRVGTEGYVEVALRTSGIWHVNKEYPTEISFAEHPSLSLMRKTFDLEQAVEQSETLLRFSVPVTPTATGQHQLKIHCTFAVCTDDNCLPDERDLLLTVQAAAAGQGDMPKHGGNTAEQGDV